MPNPAATVPLERGSTTPSGVMAGGVLPLHNACVTGDLAAVRGCLAKGIDVNQRNLGGYTPLMCAAVWGNLQVVSLLVEEGGADIHVSNARGSTPLHAAARSGHLDVAEYLLQHGAITDVHARNSSGATPMHEAACFGHVDLMRLLRKHGAKVNCRKKDLQTPLHVACSLARLPDVATFLLLEGAEINAQDCEGDTPLHLAATANNVGHVQQLLVNGAHPRIPNYAGELPIDCTEDEVIAALLQCTRYKIPSLYELTLSLVRSHEELVDEAVRVLPRYFHSYVLR